MSSLVAYFSREFENYQSGIIKNLDKGNTEIVAEYIQQVTGADIFKIDPVKAYSKKYNECIEEARIDQRQNVRPELKLYLDDISKYDTIYLGYPNYWGTMPMAVFTFLEHYDFTGKFIKPFCTHEGSAFGGSIEDIKKACPNADVQKGLAIYGGKVKTSLEQVKKWI